MPSGGWQRRHFAALGCTVFVAGLHMLRFVNTRLVEAMLAASMVIARAVSAIGDFREPDLFMVSAVLFVVGPMAGKIGAKQRLLAESSWTIRGSSNSRTYIVFASALVVVG